MIENLTRDEFVKVTNGRKHDDEIHVADGVALEWKIDGRLYQEFQPDIGPVSWSVSH